MHATWPFLLALTIAVTGGCAKRDAEPEPAAAPAEGAHPAINKLGETRTKMDAIDAKRKADAKAAEGGEAP